MHTLRAVAVLGLWASVSAHAQGTQVEVVPAGAQATREVKQAPIQNVPDNKKAEVAREAVERMREVLKKTLNHLENARDDKDVVKLNCVNEKLGAVKGLLRVAEQADVELQEALSAGNSEDAAHAFELISTAGNKTEQAMGETDACIGEVSQYTGDTTVEVEEDEAVLLEYDPTVAVNGLPPPATVVDRPPPTTTP